MCVCYLLSIVVKFKARVPYNKLLTNVAVLGNTGSLFPQASILQYGPGAWLLCRVLTIIQSVLQQPAVNSGLHVHVWMI